MPTLQHIANKFGFVLADVHTRFFELSNVNIKNFLGSTSNFQDIVLKICKIFPSCDSVRTINDLRTILYKELKKEVSELGDNTFTRYFLDGHKIHCLFSVLQNYSEDEKNKNEDFWVVEKNSVGYFEQLKCIEFCKDFEDLRSFVLKESGIYRYFEGIDIIDGEYQKVYLQVMKKYYEEYYKLSRSVEYFREIIFEEIKMFILDIYLSLSLRSQLVLFLPGSSSLTFNGECGSDQRICEYIPVVEEADQFAIDQITKKLKNVNDFNELEDIFKLESSDLYEGMRLKKIKLYSQSFKSFNDLSMIYSFLQLREHQIREVIFVVDQILNKDEQI
ncbi:uncharacterized protein VICG_00889 [Vittaforma corneae ATCC 50505]|uniref:V-type proton ATPase subunit n=1 Tax=Vittaforma corneae (strain ATCC 50505) TaxID=993615 RepID=L2GNZ4_VITCO|nr:uncharacterized protein VICG_00889 [Vittaforma corneae ATCC 50505]ELA42042.1 hypothetical protein VICG_00889 [Vittaforma corneae ATCC 50505]